MSRIIERALTSSSPEIHARNSFRLLTLGGLSLVEPAGAIVRQQRRRLALLALLAAAGERGVCRDRLVAWLSPESTTESARHALHQLLYYLRQLAGDEAFLGSDPLRLNPLVITSDLADFERALDAGSLAEATELYKGPFLHGFHLGNSSEFEDWAAQERSRLSTRYGDALSRLAGEATARRDHAEAIRWSRLAVTHDPLSGRATLDLMRSLAAGGDAPGALLHARAHSTLVRTELGSGPDPEVTALADRLHAAARTAPELAGNDASAARSSAVANRIEGRSGLETSAANVSALAHPPRHDGRTGRWPASAALVFASAAYLTIGAASAGRFDSAASRPLLVPDDQILVGDFEARPVDSLSARALAEVLRSSLAESRAVDVVSRAEVDRALERMQRPVTAPLVGQLVHDLAARNGYEAILGGALIPMAAGYVVSARLTTTGGRELAALSETATSADALIPAVGRLSKAMRRKVGESAAAIDSVPPLPDVTTRSVRALQLYTQAQDETRAGRILAPKTIQLLRDAIAADSTFAMAHRFLGIKLYRTGAIHESIRELRRAERGSDRLTEVERLTALSTLSLVLLDYPRAADEAERVLALKPNDWWATTQLAYVYPLLGRSDSEQARAIQARRRQLDPANRSDLSMASRRALYDGRYEEALALAREQHDCCRNFPGSRSSAIARGYIARAYAAMSAFDSAEHYATPRGAADRGSREIVARSQLARGQMAKAFATWGVRPRGSEGGRAVPGFSATLESSAALATFLLAGDRAAAARRLDAVVTDSALHAGDPADWPIGPLMALALVGRAADARRDLAAIEHALDADMRIVRAPELSLARGAVALAERRPRDAVAAFDDAARVFVPLGDACRVCALPWLGRAHDAAGRADSATVVYERYLSTGDYDRMVPDAIWRAVVLRRLGELHAARGDTARAVAHLERFIALWKDADRELQPQVQAARRHVGRLRGGARP